MNQSIHNHIKLHSGRWIIRTLVVLESDNQSEQSTLRYAIANLSKTWNIDLQQETIKNCFIKASFKKQSETNWSEEYDKPLLLYKGNTVSLEEYL